MMPSIIIIIMIVVIASKRRVGVATVCGGVFS
jgi:hypothetical protein